MIHTATMPPVVSAAAATSKGPATGVTSSPSPVSERAFGDAPVADAKTGTTALTLVNGPWLSVLPHWDEPAIGPGPKDYSPSWRTKGSGDHVEIRYGRRIGTALSPGQGAIERVAANLRKEFVSGWEDIHTRKPVHGVLIAKLPSGTAAIYEAIEVRKVLWDTRSRLVGFKESSGKQHHTIDVRPAAGYVAADAALLGAIDGTGWVIPKLDALPTKP